MGLDRVELVMGLEQRLEIALPDEVVGLWITVGDVVDGSFRVASATRSISRPEIQRVAVQSVAEQANLRPEAVESAMRLREDLGSGSVWVVRASSPQAGKMPAPPRDSN